MDGEERSLFERSLHQACTAHAGPALDAALEDLGWTEALTADPRAAVSSLFELQGATNTSSSALGLVIGSVLGPADRPSGSWILPPLGRAIPPGTETGGRWAARGVALAPPDDGETVLVVTGADQHHLVVEVKVTDLACRMVRGMDPRLGLVEVVAERGTPYVVRGELSRGQWPAAVARARLALAHQLVGCARAMLELARVHAQERAQFGRPISQFQAVRHRLADTLVAVEVAAAALDGAWPGDAPSSAGMAKALAGRAARTAARHCQQVLAGIGFTTEHDLHNYVRRTLVLDELFGGSRTLTGDLGRQILASRQFPAWPPL
jgi:hypothetical protein